MAKRWRALHQRAKRALSSPRCEKCGTREYVLLCKVSLWDKAGQGFHLCPTDAARQGFCCCCGLFNAGQTRFDFGPGKGYCDNCYDQITADEYAETYYDWDDDNDYCQTCGNEGFIVTCIDDLCQGGCIHGDGEAPCPDCDNWM